MKIFITGTSERIEEFKSIIPEGHDMAKELLKADLIIDLNLDENAERLNDYSDLEGKIVLGCAVKQSLASMTFHSGKKLKCRLAGINALPSFVNRSKVELSLFNTDDRKEIEGIMSALGWKAEFVEDRVGMISPRIICMIINEAYYTLQEGTANEKDIDESMKLGTNYPYGPFEWNRKIGIRNVYETLEALYQDTHEERYKICPLLKKHYLSEKE